MPKAKRDRDDNPYDSWELNEIRPKAKTDNKAGQVFSSHTSAH